MCDHVIQTTENYKSGFVGILGWTNVGKSTLVNHLTGMKIAITADCPQTTRHRLVGIFQGDDYQIALTDTPGIHQAKNALSSHMLRTTWGTMTEMDVILWMVFPDRSAELQIKAFEKQLRDSDIPVIIAVNKIDSVSRGAFIPVIEQLHAQLNPVAVVPISALTGENVDELVKVLVDTMPTGEPMFPVDQVTDQPERLIAAEYIREKIIEKMFQELPHVVAVDVDQYQEKGPKRVDIDATIYVEKKSQKGIIIGSKGEMIKAIGTEARMLISAFLGRKVNLTLWVKVSPRWRSDLTRLRYLGFKTD